MARKELMQVTMERYREFVGTDGVADTDIIIIIYEELACRESQRIARAECAIRGREGTPRTVVRSCEGMHDRPTQPAGLLRERTVEGMGRSLLQELGSTCDSRVMQELHDRCDAGIYDGLAEEANEIQVLTPGGALRANSVKRLSLAQRRDPVLVTVCSGQPRGVIPDGMPRPQRASESFAPVVPEETAPARVQLRREEAAPRQYYIRRKD